MKPVPLDDRLPGLHEPENLRSWRLTKVATFALIALGAVVWLVVDQVRAATLRSVRQTGSSVVGRVTDVESRRGGQARTISYSFTVKGTSYGIVGRKTGGFDGLESGGTITVWYDPLNPQVCVTDLELTHARFGWTPWMFGALIGVMMGLAGFQAYKVIQPRRDPELGE